MEIKKINLFIILIVIFTLLNPIGKVYGEKANSQYDRVYILIANRLSLTDLDKMENVDRLLDQASIGLMNTRGLTAYSGAEGFITINASGKAYANQESSEFHNLNDQYKELYENRTNYLVEEYNIGNIQLGKLENQNIGNNYLPSLGALGDSIHDLGLKTAVFGNSDTDTAYIRSASLIATDSKGLVDYGNIDDILIEDNNYPYNFRTDYDKILLGINQLEKDVGLVVIDSGDLNRLNSYSNFLSDPIFMEKRKNILRDLDKFLGNLLSQIDRENSLLILLSPNRSDTRVDRSRLTPLLLWGRGIDKGILTSPTTNKKGIVTNLDIGPTILNFFGGSNSDMTGSPLEVLEEDNALAYINTMNARLNLTNRIRTKTLYIYGVISMLVLGILTLLLLLKFNLEGRIGRVFKLLLAILYTGPLGLIIISIFSISNLPSFLFFLLAFILLVIFIARKAKGEKYLGYIAFIYLLIIILDLFFNNILTRYSVLSHDPIIGARYFGIGNELTGIFLGIIVIISSLLLERDRKLLALATLLISPLVIGHPGLGANVGGALALVSAVFYFIVSIRGKELNLKNTLIILFLIGSFIALLGYLDIYINPNPTHLGKNIRLLREKGWVVVENIVNRKLLMNIKLIGTSIWTRVVFINILLQTLLMEFLKEDVSSIIHGRMGLGISLGIFASMVGLVVNDSGIILAALATNLITIFLLGRLVHKKGKNL